MNVSSGIISTSKNDHFGDPTSNSFVRYSRKIVLPERDVAIRDRYHEVDRVRFARHAQFIEAGDVIAKKSEKEV
jgi:hypothetical protein